MLFISSRILRTRASQTLIPSGGWWRKQHNSSFFNVQRNEWFGITFKWGFPGGSVVKNPPANAGDAGSIPGPGRSPGERNGNPLQHSCLGNPMDRGAWRATVHGVTKEFNSTWRLNNNKLLLNKLEAFQENQLSYRLSYCKRHPFNENDICRILIHFAKIQDTFGSMPSNINSDTANNSTQRIILCSNPTYTLCCAKWDIIRGKGVTGFLCYNRWSAQFRKVA